MIIDLPQTSWALLADMVLDYCREELEPTEEIVTVVGAFLRACGEKRRVCYARDTEWYKGMQKRQRHPEGRSSQKGIS